jgi:phosphatidylglycerophosphate synthase
MTPSPDRNRWKFSDALKAREVDEFVDRWIHRPLAFLVILPLENRGAFITPLTITIAAMVTGVMAGGAFALAGPDRTHWYLVGGLLVLLSVVLDCADGMLARLRNATSRLGQVLDGYSDAVAGLAIWAGLCFAASKGINPWIAWPLNGLALLTILFHVSIYDKFRENFVRVTAGLKPEPEPELPERARWLWTALANSYDTGYARAFRLAGGISREALALSPERFRAAFAGPMQLLSCIGLGSHLAQIYVLAIVAVAIPNHFYAIAQCVIIGASNLVMIAALVWWRKRERAVCAAAPAG